MIFNKVHVYTYIYMFIIIKFLPYFSNTHNYAEAITVMEQYLNFYLILFLLDF